MMIGPMIAALIFLAICVILTIVNIKVRENFDLIPAITLIILVLVMNLMLFLQRKTSYVEVKDGTLTYTSLLKSTKQIKLADVEKAYFAVGKSAFKPHKRIEVEPASNSAAQPFCIMFNDSEREKMKELLDILETK